MSINNITGNYGGYLNSLSMMNSEIKDTYSSKSSLGKSSEFKDILDISTSRKNLSRTNDIGGITIDKGTANGTTINVDRNTILSIMNYAVNNVETSGFEELGMDDNKRWVVINGQRFECELSPAEKELIRKAKKGNNLLSYINEADDKKYKRDEEKETIQMKFNNGRPELSHDTNNPKIQNLLNNDKVMAMLSAISNYNPIKLQL